MLHDANADAIGEQIAEQALDEDRRTGEELADCDGGQFEGDQPPDSVPIGGLVDRMNHGIDNPLADQEACNRHQGAERAQHHHCDGEGRVCRPDERDERGDVAKRGKAFAPRGLPIIDECSSHGLSIKLSNWRASRGSPPRASERVASAGSV